jgi:acetolactate synthase-1/2/3 large subunit
MQPMTTAQATVATLIAHGIDTVYCVPGVHNDPLLDALHGAQDRIRVRHARHEQTAGYMALGAALATGRPQVFAVVPGPGILNASAALLTAWGMNAPVLALVGQIPHDAIDRGHGHLHELPDQLGLLRHLTKFAARIKAPFEAPGLVAEALHQATTGRQRPVALECAIDVWGRSGPAEPCGPRPHTAPPVDGALVRQAAAILAGARRPVIVVGGGAQDAGPEVLAVAEALDAPVISFRRGRGVIPTAHPLAVSLPVGHRLWPEVDAVLAVGTRFYIQNSVWGTDPALKIVRVDIDPDEPSRFRTPEVVLVADAGDALRALLPHLPPQPRATADWLAPHQAWFATRLERLEPQMGFVRAMRAALPPDGILVDEVTQLGFANRLAFPVPGPRHYIAAGYQDNLGFGFGTALGVAAACPDRTVLSIAGDGGFAYQAMELATAVRHRLPLVVVVFDDGAFGNVRRIQKEAYGNRLIASDLANPDFCKFAESFGVAAFRAHTAAELEDALRSAFALRAPALVHVPVGEMPSPWDMLLLPRMRGMEDSWRRNLP